MKKISFLTMKFNRTVHLRIDLGIDLGIDLRIDLRTDLGTDLGIVLWIDLQNASIRSRDRTLIP